MPLTTIYDIRSGSDVSLQAGLALITAPLAVMALAATIRIAALPGQRKGRRVQIAICAITGLVLAIAAWSSLSGAKAILKQRQNLRDGRFTVAAGPVSRAQLVRFTRANNQAFRVQNQWFFAPANVSLACLPRNGDVVRIAYQPNPPYAGTILRFEIAKTCD